MFNYFVIVNANNLSVLLPVIRGTRWAPHTLPEHMSSHPVCSGVPVVRSLVSFIVFCTSLFVFVSCFFWSMYCLSSFGQCIVCPPLINVLSVLLWSMYCLSSFGQCIVCPPLVNVLSVLLWSMYCLSSFDQCIVCPPLVNVLSVLLQFTVYVYPFGIFKYFLSIYVSWYLTRGRHWNFQVDIVEQYPSIQCSHSSLYTK
jgi:hypothetical protein